MKNILLIEDDLQWQIILERNLEDLGLVPKHICSNLEAARQYLMYNKPDLIIADVMIDSHYSFEIFEEEHSLKIPSIFVTASLSETLYQRSKKIPHTTYLIKPFHYLSLKAAIENVTNKLNKETEVSAPIGLEIRNNSGEKFFLHASKIIYLQSIGNYTAIYTVDKKYVIKKPLHYYQSILNNQFTQIHRSFLVNKSHISHINHIKMEVMTPKGALPISRRHKKFDHNLLE